MLLLILLKMSVSEFSDLCVFPVAVLSNVDVTWAESRPGQLVLFVAMPHIVVVVAAIQFAQVVRRGQRMQMTIAFCTRFKTRVCSHSARTIKVISAALK